MPGGSNSPAIHRLAVRTSAPAMLATWASVLSGHKALATIPNFRRTILSLPGQNCPLISVALLGCPRNGACMTTSPRETQRQQHQAKPVSLRGMTGNSRSDPAHENRSRIDCSSCTAPRVHEGAPAIRSTEILDGRGRPAARSGGLGAAKAQSHEGATLTTADESVQLAAPSLGALAWARAFPRSVQNGTDLIRKGALCVVGESDSLPISTQMLIAHVAAPIALAGIGTFIGLTQRIFVLSVRYLT